MTRHFSHTETIFIARVYPSANALKAINTTDSNDYPNNMWAFITGEGEYYLDRSSSAVESLPNVIAPTTGIGRWIKKAITLPGTTSLVYKIANAGGTPKAREFYNFSMSGQASSTTGLLTKAATNNANALGALPTTSPYDAGINNGAIDPYIVPFAGTVKSIRIALAQSAIAGAGPVASGVTIRMDIYKMTYSSRTLLASYDIPLDSTKVNVFNNLGSDGFQTAVLSGLSTPLSAGDLIGLQFTNRSTGNNVINAAGRIYATLEVSEN